MNNKDYIEYTMKTLGYCPDKYIYEIEKVLKQVDYQQIEVIGNDNSFYFLENYFTNIGEAPNGYIMSKNNALSLNSINQNTEMYKKQMFRGQIIIRNNINTRGASIFLEFYIVNPIKIIEYGTFKI